MKRKNLVNDWYFDLIDCEDKAYLLGFFIADGTIRLQPRCKNSFSLSLHNSIDDFEVLRFYQDRICPDNKFFFNNNQNGVKYKRKLTVFLKWTSTHMKETLEKYGICLRKTYNTLFEFNFDIIPKTLHWDFIRGLLDGDGTITSKGYLSFIVNSEKFAEQIKSILEENKLSNCVIDKVIKTYIPYWVIRVNGYNHDKYNTINKIYHLLYDNK